MWVLSQLSGCLWRVCHPPKFPFLVKSWKRLVVGCMLVPKLSRRFKLTFMVMERQLHEVSVNGGERKSSTSITCFNLLVKFHIVILFQHFWVCASCNRILPHLTTFTRSPG